MAMSRPANDDPLEAQQSLVESSLELVFQTFDEAVERGDLAPVIVLVDCEDDLGGAIARGWLGDEAVDDAIAMHDANEESDNQEHADPTTVFARALPWSDCRNEIVQAFPYLAEALTEPPTDEAVLVISITAGGASALTAPGDARPA